MKISTELNYMHAEALLTVYWIINCPRWNPKEALADFATNHLNDRLLIFEGPSKIESIQLCRVSDSGMLRVTAKGNQKQIEDFAFLLCGVYGKRLKVTIDDTKHLTAQQATLL